MYIYSISHNGCTTKCLVPEEAQNCATKCPDCQEKIEKNDSEWTILRLPCPIVQSHAETACSIVIKPTNGGFRSYKMGDDLHIGISNSHGIVHSFWTKGIEIQKSTWQNSTILLDLRPFFFGNLEFLDNCIEFFVDTMKISKKFQKLNYREATWNCFDFVLEFLKFINFRQYGKSDFSKEFVIKRLQNVVKYCQLVEKLKREKCINL